MKILITGGHAAPAIAVAEQLKKYPDVEIVFVGRKYLAISDWKLAISHYQPDANHQTSTTKTFEYQEITSLNIPFIHLRTGRLTRIISIKTLLDFLKLPLGLYSAYKILKKEKPDKILVFGGYIALPIALIGYVLKIPVFTHEQTLIPGLANKIIARFAQKNFISFPETATYFKNAIYTGNPLRKEILAVKERGEKTFYFKIKYHATFMGRGSPSAKQRPRHALRGGVLYKESARLLIIGGSLGSHYLNLLIEKNLPKLLDKFKIRHIAGDAGDFDRLSKIHHKNYKVYKYLFSKELAEEFYLSDLIICRAGANTVFELIALEKPAILVPLPWSAGGEQYAHAKLLKEKGAAEIFYQNPELISGQDSLFELIIKIMDNWQEYHKNYFRLKNYYQKNAAETIIRQVLAER